MISLMNEFYATIIKIKAVFSELRFLFKFNLLLIVSMMEKKFSYP